MKKYIIRLFTRKAVCNVFLIALSICLLSGCSGTASEDELFFESVNNVQSVEASISLEMSGNVSQGGGYFGSSGSYTGSQNHSASIGSDITVQATFLPHPAYHAESFSRIIVDGATTREDRETYVVPEGANYVSFDYKADTEKWQRQPMTNADAQSIRCKVAFPSDWEKFMEKMSKSSSESASNGDEIYIYTGTVNKNVLQEIFGNNIFGTFMYSVQQLLDDEINCTLRVNSVTMLPIQFDLEFEQSWTVNDMSFDTATVTVKYTNFNSIAMIEVPKKISVVADDPETEFYSTYYAWNLFLPYIGGQLSPESGSSQSGQQHFASAWDTFQIRIDGGMTKIPLPFEDLKKVGYMLNENQSSIIIEANKYLEDVVVLKGEDQIVCTFYNDDTVPQPIANCKIGSISINAADQKHNGIVIYLPGEVTLGILQENLLSAYGEATETVSAFASDTLIWKGESEQQWFEAEISPVTGRVIRLEVANIPVTGGAQI